MPKESVYYVDVTHGSLANDHSIFPGIADILSNGTTTLLPNVRPSSRSAGQVFKMPPSDNDLTIEGIQNTLLAIGEDRQATRGEEISPLHVSVSNGDIKYSSYPLLCGHFEGDGILQAERDLDNYLDGVLSQRLRLELYPGRIGTSEIFLSTKNSFNGAIIVGLGQFGKLSAYQLSLTIEQGVTKYLLEVNNQDNHSKQRTSQSLGVSSLIIGSAYAGLPLESSVRGILQGIHRANEKMKLIYQKPPRVIEFVEFIELYENRALNCFYALGKIQRENSSTVRISLAERKIVDKPGARDKISLDFSAAWWTRISVTLASKSSTATRRCLQFTVATGDAGQRQRDLYLNPRTMDQLLMEFSGNNRWSDDLARTIFELLIPNDFKEELTRQNNIVWIVDDDTAWYPWEMLQDSAKAKPLSVNGGMIRQKETKNFRSKIKPVSSDTALVIADPVLDGYLNQLPHARTDGNVISTLLSSKGYVVNGKIESNASEITKALFSKDYKIIHLAGHGMFNEDPEEDSGMVIGNKTFLSSFMISQMSTVPELVFVNCCYLGSVDAKTEDAFQKRYHLAANLGTQLIDNGVKAVVAAGWAVHDAAALEFATVFYQQMFAGVTFGDAVKAARAEIYLRYPQTNSWGAYQCYGDPQYRLTITEHYKTSTVRDFVVAKEVEIELDNLRSEIQAGAETVEMYRSRLEEIIKKAKEAKLNSPRILEKEGLIYGELCFYDECITRLEALRTINNADFSVHAMERLYNIKAKKVVSDVVKSNPKEKAKLRKKALSELKKDQKQLLILLGLGKTIDRLTTLGSFHKRKGFVTDPIKQQIVEFRTAARYYQSAHVSESNPNPEYTMSNWIELEKIISLYERESWGNKVKSEKSVYWLPSKETLCEDLKKLRQRDRSNRMDYLGMISLANVELATFMLQPDSKAPKMDVILSSYKNAWAKMGSQGRKQSEIEHLDILIAFLNTVNLHNKGQRSAEAKKKLNEGLNIVKTLITVREELYKILSNNNT